MKIYTVTILKNCEFDYGENAEFQFDKLEDAINFMELCFENGHVVEIERTIIKG